MGQRIQLDKEDQAVLLFSKARQKWEDKTSAITAIYSAYYYQKFTGYDIYFNGSEGKFFYKKENVQFLEKTGNIEIEKKDIYVDGEIVDALRVHQFEQGFYRVYIGRRSLFTRNLRLESNKHKDILKYYSKLADHAGLIAEENSPLFFLSLNYKRITPSVDSVLFDYLKGVCNPIIEEGTMALPFDFNQSQVSAIESALKNKISIIEGPPGTGKTQTILNLIASIIYRGMNCAVVSNNNTAIDNIYEKLDEEKLSFIAATLGRATRVAEFFESEQNAGIPNFLEEEGRELKRNDSLRINILSNEMKKIQAAEVETAILESQRIDIQNESRHYENVPDDTLIIKRSLSSADYLAFITRLESSKKIRFFERWRLGRRFRVNIVKEDVHNLLNNAETLYYQTKINELTRKIESGKKFIERHNKERVAKELKALYRIFLENSIRNHYKKYGFKEFNKASYKHDFDNFLKRYPVVLSTSQSLLNNAPKGFTFDYLIIDEASQGDLLSNLLAMSCAKNLVIVGDSRQLQQIDEVRLFPKSKELSLEYNVPKAYQYESNSILTSVKDAVPEAPTTLLREHYRCAPDIINFCNKMYYDGKLVPMTRNSGRHIEVIKSAPGNHARSNPYGSGLYNQREIDEIEQVLKSSKSNSIGIISPFRYHANLISNKYATNRIEADTIHKFQGRQKEEIILSFVVNSLEKAPDAIENRLYDFVTNAKLLNVAISRGRDKVTVIVADKVYHSSNNAIKDFIRYAEYLYGSDITKESAISSVFDILYSEYTDSLLSKFKARPKGHFTELLMSEILKEVLNDYMYIGFSMHTRLGKLVKVPDTFSEEERRYIQHPWTHVDFLFFNKLSKEKLFVLEVDGIRYHEQDKKQHEHDNIKNRVLEANNIPIYRFKTNESNEKQRLREILYGFTY
jgi:superfamily I DNA and/or RNA helicase